MEKVIEKVKLTSLFDPTKTVEVEAVIDTGATMLVVPQNLVDELGLRKIRETKVRYANNKVESKWVYGAVTVELKGRRGISEVLAEETGSQPLVGQILLEALDLIVEPTTRRLIPNPRSPEMPMVEIFAATRLTSLKPSACKTFASGETNSFAYPPAVSRIQYDKFQEVTT